MSVANISKNKNGDSEVTINYHKFSNLTKDFKKREKTKTIVIKRKWDFYNELMDFLVEMQSCMGRIVGVLCEESESM